MKGKLPPILTLTHQCNPGAAAKLKSQTRNTIHELIHFQSQIMQLIPRSKTTLQIKFTKISIQDTLSSKTSSIPDLHLTLNLNQILTLLTLFEANTDFTIYFRFQKS